MKSLFLILALLAITVLQAAWVFFIWPTKIASEFTLMGLPFLLVFFTHGFLYRRCLKYFRIMSRRKFAALLVLSFFTALVSWWISMLPAVSAYGT